MNENNEKVISNVNSKSKEKRNVPNLRFKEFCDEWKDKKLNSFCTINPNTENIKEKFIYIDLGSVIDGCLLTEKIVNYNNAPSRAQRVLKENDILFQCVRPYQINNLFFKLTNKDLQYVASTGYAQIRTENYPLFVYYLLNSSIFNKKVLLLCTGSNYPAISSSDLGKIRTYICSKNEQLKIGNFFELLDKRIRTQSKIIKDLEILKKLICSQLFLKISNKMQLSKLCSITTGKLDANKMDKNGSYPFFTCGKETLKINTYAFDCEAILISGNGDIGHTKYYNGKFNAYQRTYVLYNFKSSPIFIKYAIDHVLPRKIKEEMQSSAMPYIKLSTLANLNIPYPAINIQNKIIDILNVFQKKLDLEISILKKFKEQKKYLLANMFI